MVTLTQIVKIISESIKGLFKNKPILDKLSENEDGDLIYNGSRISSSSDGVPIGTMLTFIGDTLPVGFLKCDGSEYNITEYQDLADFITAQFGKANYFGGDGKITFAVPDINYSYTQDIKISMIIKYMLSELDAVIIDKNTEIDLLKQKIELLNQEIELLGQILDDINKVVI